MKTIKKTFMFLIFSIFTLSFSNSNISVNAQNDYTIDGGLYEINFNDETDIGHFTTLSEHKQHPYIYDGELYFKNTCEQKVIFREHKVTDYYMVEADFMPIVKKGRIDCGFYVQATEADSKLDSIRAYNVNIEHEIGSDSYYLKLHRFSFGWLGAKVEIPNNRYMNDKVHLKVVVKEGFLYAFVNYSETPNLTYNIGIEPGYVGIRSFRAPNKIDNFRLVSGDISLNKTPLSELISNSEQLLNSDKYTATTLNDLKVAVDEAKDVLNNSKNAVLFENAINNINKAINNLDEAFTIEILKETIFEAETYLGKEDMYTKNSYASLLKVIELSKQLTGENTEDEISYWCAMLKHRIDSLISYKED